jgi:hypothetical protein
MKKKSGVLESPSSSRADRERRGEDQCSIWNATPDTCLVGEFSAKSYVKPVTAGGMRPRTAVATKRGATRRSRRH